MNKKGFISMFLLVTMFMSLINVNLEAKATTVPGDTIIDSSGGFIITESMLDMPFNKITFPATHNSFALDGRFPDTEANQDLSIPDQLIFGIRVFDFDVDQFMQLRHGSTSVSMDKRLVYIKEYVEKHPNQVFMIRVNNMPSKSGDMYERINGRLENMSIDQYIYNWDATKAKNDRGRCYIPETWPTLREMIDSGKNVMFIHNGDFHDIVDSYGYRGLGRWEYNNPTYNFSWKASELEDFSLSQGIWSPANNAHQKDGANRLFNIEVTPDNDYPAGDALHATRNNDGRKLYQIAKQWEDSILPDGRVPNIIALDFYMSESLPGTFNRDDIEGTTRKQPISVIDACNRLNIERSGLDYSKFPGAKEFVPHEFEFNYVDQVAATPVVRDEAKGAVELYKQGYEYMSATCWNGNIWSNGHWENLYGHGRLPEHALDGDMITRWSDSTDRDNNVLAIDFGEPKQINEIAIAWEYVQRRPGYKVYASNDSRFANGFSNDLLNSGTGWGLPILSKNFESGSNVAWDVNAVTEGRYRYLKILIDDPRSDTYPSMWEVKVFAKYPIRIRNNGTGDYLYHDGGSSLSYRDSVAITDNNAKWDIEYLAGGYRFKNIATGQYINIDNFAGSTTPLVKGSTTQEKASYWQINKLGEHRFNILSDYWRLGQSRYLNTAAQDNFVQATTTVGDAAKGEWDIIVGDPVRIKNQWSNQFLYVNESGEVLTYTDQVGAGDNKALWNVEKLGNGKYRLRNYGTGRYVAADSNTSEGHIPLYNNTVPSHLTTQFTIENRNNDSFRIKTDYWRLGGAQYLNVEDQDGKVQRTALESDWHSAVWYKETGSTITLN